MNKQFFTKKELRCRGCPTGDFCDQSPWSNVDPEALDMLNELREAMDQPLLLNSASRCPRHNLRVGGAKRSKHLATEHLRSTAFDISTDPKRYSWYNLEAPDQDDLIATAVEIGFNGIGVYRTFVHVDKRDRSARW